MYRRSQNWLVYIQLYAFMLNNYLTSKLACRTQELSAGQKLLVPVSLSDSSLCVGGF